MKTGFKGIKDFFKREKKVTAGRARMGGAQRAREDRVVSRIPKTLMGGLQRAEQGPSFGSSATPDDSSAQISHADRRAPGSLKGTMVHTSVQTVRGQGVVPDKLGRIQKTEKRRR